MADIKGNIRGFNAITTADPILRQLFSAAYERGLTMEEVGRRIDRTPESLSNWKRGRRTPNIMDTNILAEALGFSIVLKAHE